MSTRENVNLAEVQQKLYEKLKPSGWADKLKGFILSDDFMSILQTLLKESLEGDRFTPVIANIFRAFEECPYNELKVVIIGQDPYPKQNIADGIAFSCKGGDIQASLRYIFREVEDTVYPEGGYVWDPDLKRWSNQGVLLLNTALTTTVNQIGKHYKLWQPFIAYVLDILAFQNSGLVYAFVGKIAQNWQSSIPSNNYKLTAVHPAAASYAGDEKWDSDDLFNKINDIVYKQFKTKIIW